MTQHAFAQLNYDVLLLKISPLFEERTGASISYYHGIYAFAYVLLKSIIDNISFNFSRTCMEGLFNRQYL